MKHTIPIYKVQPEQPLLIYCAKNHQPLLAHLSLGTSRAVVCVCDCVFTFSNMNISETSGPIANKFYLKHHWVGEKAVFSFGPNRIGTLVSMATDSSQRVIMGKCCEHASTFIFYRIFLILTDNEDNRYISDKFDFGPDSTKDCGVSCP